MRNPVAHRTIQALTAFTILFLLAACGGRSTSTPGMNQGLPDNPPSGSSAIRAYWPEIPASEWDEHPGCVPVLTRPDEEAELPEGLKGLSVASPATVLSGLPAPPRQSSFVEAGLTRKGSDWLISQPNQRVASTGDSLLFDTAVGSNWLRSDLAYAMYMFSLDGYPDSGRPQTLELKWDDRPRDGRFFVALSDYSLNRWVWYAGPGQFDDVIRVPSFSRFLDPVNDSMIVMVLTLDMDSSQLWRLRIGVNEWFGAGLDNSVPAPVFRDVEPPARSDDLPGRYTLPATGFPPVNNQGSLQSCTGWATTYYAYSYELNRIYGPNWDVSRPSFQGSPLWTYANTPGSCTEGRNMLQVLNFLRQNGAGIRSREGVPDVCANTWDQLSELQADAAVLRPDTLSEQLCMGPGGVTNLKTVLVRQNRPIIVAMEYDWEFTQLTTGGPWTYGSGREFPLGLGSHAVTIVGFDDSVNSFRILNSWGRGWGDNGYAWMSYTNFLDESGSVQCFTLRDEWSQAVFDRFFPATSTLPPPRSVLALDGAEPDYIEITWEASPGAAGYRIFRDNPGVPIATVDAATLSYRDYSLPSSDAYKHYYWVAAMGAAGLSRLSTEDSGYLETAKVLLPKIESIHPAGHFRGGQDVTWTADLSGELAGLSFSWDFGGGTTPNTSSDQQPVVNLSAPGSYTGTLTVTNANGSDALNFSYSYTAEGQLPQASLSVSPGPYVHPGDAVVFDASASQAFQGKTLALYKWDFEGDGSYEYVSDQPLAYRSFDTPGPRDIRLTVVDSENAQSNVSSFTLPVVNPGWMNYQLDPTNDSGTYIQLIRLLDGRLGAVYGVPAGLRWAVSKNAAPSSAGEWDFVDLPWPVGQGSIGHDLALIGGKPAIAVNVWGDYALYYISSSTADGANQADWSLLLVDTDGGTGIGAGIALDEVAGRPAIAYIGEVANGATPDLTDTCLCMAFRRANDASGTTWGPLVDVDSQNITPAMTYHGVSCDLEVVAGYPALIYARTGLSGQPGVTQVMYAWNSMPDGSGSWSRDLVIDGDIGSAMGTLMDCGGVPAWVASRSTSVADDVTFIYGAGSSNGGPGSPWHFRTVIPYEVNNGYQALSARYHGGKPWFIASNYNSNDLVLWSPADGAGNGPWSPEIALNYTAMAATELVLNGGPPCIGYVYAGFNVNARFAIRYD